MFYHMLLAHTVNFQAKLMSANGIFGGKLKQMTGARAC